MSPIVLGIVGGGWRAEFFMRIAQAAPERFAVAGVVVRNEEKGREFERQWNVPTFRTVEELADSVLMSFAVISVPREASPEMINRLAGIGVPVLAETPPAASLEQLIDLVPLMEKGAKVQVAEQYPFQPMHAARQAVAQSGKLGDVSQVQMSAAHGYHGMALLRKLLGNTFENAEIRALTFTSPLIAGPGRHGAPAEHKINVSKQTIATIQYDNGKLGVFDFTGDQYFSWIRSQRFLIRGEKGEIVQTNVSYLENFLTPVHTELKRVNAGEDGNLEGFFMKGIMLGGEWIYNNPIAPARLSDDEIAIAECLIRMDSYVNGGPSFYGLAEACQDHYFALMLERSASGGQPIRTETQPWAELAR